ncbi:uncharacterized protein LOC100369922 [Saccoglossus kowalevskii]|uniref:Uncharacterized protein LOC100369922 n=1 Tax=Saccoglossus kowalevskii TaxID=10224 RepID=A0ABM0GRV6_SACKO|nr:PREDICTED: uncharacterized protein LOC100369922 [Saccoglossus kowalevskii]
MKRELMCVVIVCCVMVNSSTETDFRKTLMNILSSRQYKHEIAEVGRSKEVFKRFGCYRHQCPEDETCLENQHGDGYCVKTAVIQGKNIDEFENDIPLARRLKDLFKRFGCYRHQCPEDETCLENQHGDGYCVKTVVIQGKNIDEFEEEELKELLRALEDIEQ